MRTVRHLLLALAIAATLAAAPDVGASTATQGEYLVTAGAVDPALGDNPNRPTDASRTDRFDYLTYYPESLRIHRGDTVLFRRDGFHTVTFAPSEDDVPWFYRRDEVEGVTAQRGDEPSHPACVNGAGEQPAAPIETACVIDDPNERVYSGWRSMKLTFDLPPGTYAYFCNIHSGMAGEVEIVADSEPLAAPAELAADRAEQLTQDTAAAEAVMAAGQTPIVRTEGDQRIWQVKAGDFTADGRVAVVRFLPSDLTIAPGDDVEFVVEDNRIAEGHTASFPADAYPFGILTYLNPTCDPDAPAGGAPGVPLQYAALFVGCPDGTNLEFAIQPWLWQAPLRAPDQLVTTPATVHDSGLLSTPEEVCRVSCDPWTGEPFPSSSRASFPNAGSFAYVCNIHPEYGMAGAITVDP